MENRRSGPGSGGEVAGAVGTDLAAATSRQVRDSRGQKSGQQAIARTAAASRQLLRRNRLVPGSGACVEWLRHSLFRDARGRLSMRHARRALWFVVLCAFSGCGGERPAGGDSEPSGGVDAGSPEPEKALGSDLAVAVDDAPGIK